MGHFIGHGERNFFVEDDGTVWDTGKKVQYDPVTFEILGSVTKVVKDIPNVDRDDLKEKLEGMSYWEIRKAYKITGERSKSKPKLIKAILAGEADDQN